MSSRESAESGGKHYMKSECLSRRNHNVNNFPIIWRKLSLVDERARSAVVVAGLFSLSSRSCFFSGESHDYGCDSRLKSSELNDTLHILRAGEKNCLVTETHQFPGEEHRQGRERKEWKELDSANAEWRWRWGRAQRRTNTSLRCLDTTRAEGDREKSERLIIFT